MVRELFSSIQLKRRVANPSSGSARDRGRSLRAAHLLSDRYRYPAIAHARPAM